MRFLFILILTFGFTPFAFAQSEFKPAATFSQGSGPIRIEADTLEVRDKEKAATFTGNVVVTRNDSVIRAAKMTVFYSGDGTADTGAAGLPAAEQQVKRIEMTGSVLFTQKDQQGSGDAAVYDRVSETLTMSGNVALTQGQNVAKGQKLIVDMRTGRARLEGRPRMILVPNQQKAQKR